MHRHWGAMGSRRPATPRPPVVSESAAGTDAPVPVLTGEVVVLDGQTAVKDPAVTGPAEDQAGMHDVDAVAPDMAAAGVQEPVARRCKDPAVAELQEPVAEVQEPAVAEAGAQEPPVIEATAGLRDPGIPAQRWSEILVDFVDDPRGSVKMAADAVDSAIDEFVTSVQARQQALASTWQGSDTGTEVLRTALREYRRLASQVQQMSPA